MGIYMLGTVRRDDIYLIGKMDKGQYVIAEEEILITKGDQTIKAEPGDWIVNTGKSLNIIEVEKYESQ